jgi:hypothetical protein
MAAQFARWIKNLILEAETVFETLYYNAILTQLFAQERVIAFGSHESLKSHICVVLLNLTGQ